MAVDVGDLSTIISTTVVQVWTNGVVPVADPVAVTVRDAAGDTICAVGRSSYENGHPATFHPRRLLAPVIWRELSSGARATVSNIRATSA